MAFLLFGMPLCAQENGDKGKSLLQNLHYQLEGNLTSSNSQTPLWLNANKHGLSSLSQNNGYLCAGIMSPIETDSTRHWKTGYGLDVALAYNHTSSFIIQQLYADIQYKKVRISIGSKERPMEFKNNILSSGSQTFGINARPIPQICIELPEYISLDRGHWIGIKGHFGYGIMTDGSWQKDYSKPHYIKQALYHSKAGYLRIGNENKFPLVFEGGLEMACLFGGNFYSLQSDGHYAKEALPQGFSSFFKAIYGGGSDPGEGIYANAGGNTVGSWLASITYHFPTWKLRAYYDHYFEDHSQMFLEYGLWKDGLWGLEVTFPKNKVISSLVAEFLSTKDQSGPIYHDHTPEISDQISARDDYYNHYLYNGWQHWGQAIGNPLYTSPLYRNDHTLEFTGNRFKSYHIGLSGNPTGVINYRLLYSYQENWGTYLHPFANKRYNNSLLAEITYSPTHLPWNIKSKGWSITAAYGMDHGHLIGNHQGMQITLRKTGLLNH